MTAIREQIFAAIDTRLSAIEGLGEYERMPSGEPSRFPALFTFDEGDRETTGEAGSQPWTLAVGIDGYVEGGEGAAAHAAAHALYTAAIEALFTEPVLGGLATEIEANRLDMFPVERASARRIAFKLDLTIHYATRRGSPQTID